MTCPRCGFGNHSRSECPERLEEYHGVPSDHSDDEDQNAVSLRDGETRDDDNVHARRNAAQLEIAKEEGVTDE